MSRQPRYMNFGHKLPDLFSIPLFGNRKRHGLQPVVNDTCWETWCANYTEVMKENKGFTVSEVVYNSSYRHVKNMNVDGKRILEIGPGDMDYLKYLTGQPAMMELVDVDNSMLAMAEATARSAGIPCTSHLIDASDDPRLPFDSDSIDILFSFFIFTFHL